MTLLAAWNRTWRADPGAPALMDAATGRTWTRGEIEAGAADWAAAHGRGLRGSAVVFAEPNGARWLEVFLGLLRAGAIVAAVEPGEPAPAQRALAHTAGAASLWTNGRWEAVGPRRTARYPAGTPPHPVCAGPRAAARRCAPGLRDHGHRIRRCEPRAHPLRPFLRPGKHRPPAAGPGDRGRVRRAAAAAGRRRGHRAVAAHRLPLRARAAARAGRDGSRPPAMAQPPHGDFRGRAAPARDRAAVSGALRPEDS